MRKNKNHDFSVVNQSEIAIIEKRLADEKEEGIWGNKEL